MTNAFGAPSWDRAAQLVDGLQTRICSAAAALEEGPGFRFDDWRSDDDEAPLRGRGSTRVLADGRVFEKGGVNTSVVSSGMLPASVLAQRPELAGHAFFAAGVSVVMHPRNPHAPTAHCNFRYFETTAPDGSPGAWWFGGGADLTPYFPVLDDVRHFHGALRGACDAHDATFYPAFKAWCDRYFFLKHRNETRGVGGIFYDYLDAAGGHSFDDLLAFSNDAGSAFVEAYFPLVDRHAADAFDAAERAFQLLRRGRYVEFNLLYDRGTLFGLQSGGRSESILMSLPPLVRWSYDEHPEAERALLPYLQARDWFAEDPFAS